ncbi:MAG: glycosyltransferase family 1 protein [Thermogemmatispora sp.]|uniref:glycosyltransferase family 4 protein n=1 Tax=Thermogemmatispora sp. TaxID=1968838 RepID=UPI001DE8BBEC|nr:glycosyltransferase family 1 protein [Thermogemmatispora sp.]MBX5449127.1 glycosyltransferase family 1 protein [Thermogemmatispora sp.]
MRVAIITENFLPKLDGVTRTLARLLTHLEATGHRALVLGPRCGMHEYAGAEIVTTPGIPLPFYPELKFNFFRPLFLKKLKQFQPDIIHVVDPVVLGAVGVAVAKLLRRPLVSSYHTNLAAYCRHFGFPWLTGLMWRYNRFLHNHCALTFCPSPSTARALRQQGFQRVRLWPRGVDGTLFRPERRRPELRVAWLGAEDEASERCVLLYVGRISREKNLLLLAKAYRQLDHRRCHLVIVGGGPALAELRQALAGLPVTFTGYLSGEALAEAYASADIFAFPSTTETFGQVVLEALASGLPVVGLQAEGICDLVVHDEQGLLLDPTGLSPAAQVAAYRDLLERLVYERSTRERMRAAALAQAARYSWYEAMESLLRGYEEVMLQTEQALLAA